MSKQALIFIGSRYCRIVVAKIKIIFVSYLYIFSFLMLIFAKGLPYKLLWHMIEIPRLRMGVFHVDWLHKNGFAFVLLTVYSESDGRFKAKIIKKDREMPKRFLSLKSESLVISRQRFAVLNTII